MTCGDEAEFAVSVGADGRIEDITFETESCAVSRAVASMLADHLEGRSVEAVAATDDIVPELLDGQFPEIRRDCVTGPEEMLRAGIRDRLAVTAENSSP